MSIKDYTISDIEKMTEKELLQERFNKHKEIIKQLQTELFIAEARAKLIKIMFDNAIEEVFKKYPVVTAEDRPHFARKADDLYKLSEENFNLYNEVYCADRFFKLGYTKKDGTYNKEFDGSKIQIEAEKNLMLYMINNVFVEFVPHIKQIMQSYKLRKQLLEICKNSPR